MFGIAFVCKIQKSCRSKDVCKICMQNTNSRSSLRREHKSAYFSSSTFLQDFDVAYHIVIEIPVAKNDCYTIGIENH